MTLADHYLAARNRGCDYPGALRYALDLTVRDLIRSFK